MRKRKSNTCIAEHSRLLSSFVDFEYGSIIQCISFSCFKNTNTYSQFDKIGVEMNLRIWQSEQRKTQLNIYQPFWMVK